MPQPEEVLDGASRCVLTFAGQRGPLVSPMAYWFDGSSLWMATPAASVKAAALRQRPQCAVHVPAPTGVGDDVVVEGNARIYGLHDPLGLAVHGAFVSAAMGALASRNAGTILGYITDARNVPQRFRPQNRVALRVRVENARAVARPDLGPGVAPALPTVVSPEVRRGLTGQRHVTAAVQDGAGRVVAGPAVWGAGFALRFPDGDEPPQPAAAAVHVGADPRGGPADVAGLTLCGRLEGGRLAVERATWWEGFGLQSADVPPPARSSVVLPD